MGDVLVWRHCGEPSAACNILQQNKFGSGSVLVWGGISLVALHELTRGNLTPIRSLNEILRPLLRPYDGAVGPEFHPLQGDIWTVSVVPT